MAVILRSVAMFADKISDDLKPIHLMWFISNLSIVQLLIASHAMNSFTISLTPCTMYIVQQHTRCSVMAVIFVNELLFFFTAKPHHRPFWERGIEGAPAK